MSQIPLIKMSVLMVGIIGIVKVANGTDKKDEELKEPLLPKQDSDRQFQFEVIEDGTTEKDDMAKAIQIGKTFFWRNMIAAWECENEDYNEPQEIGKNSIGELKEICENWKMKALAADAFVKSWKCKEKRKYFMITLLIKIDEGQQPLKEVKCLCVKPRFLVEQGELQLSSAMEAIKAIYRDLFKWGNGKGLKIEIEFENERAWDLVDRWLKAFKGLRIEQNDKVNQMLKKAQSNQILLKAENALKFDPYFEKFENSEFSQQFSNAPPRFRSALDAIKGLLASISEFTYDDKKKNRNYLEEFLNVMKEYEKQLNLLQNKNLNDDQQFKVLKQLKQESIKLWDIAQQLGLAYLTMCEAGTKFMETLGNEPNEEAQQNAIEQFRKEFNDEAMANKHFQNALEELIGILFMATNNYINSMMKKTENYDKLKQLLVPDPCEEAKLKVKKVDKMDKIIGKIDKIDIGESSKVNSHKRSIDDDQQKKETK